MEIISHVTPRENRQVTSGMELLPPEDYSSRPNRLGVEETGHDVVLWSMKNSTVSVQTPRIYEVIGVQRHILRDEGRKIWETAQSPSTSWVRY